jgi:hypothetical protein
MKQISESLNARLLRQASDAAAGWHGLARAYYGAHQKIGGAACQCGTCLAYRQREAREQAQQGAV